MPSIEEIIIQNSPVKEAKLYGPSKKAMENPTNGITIVNPAAVNVIKDCATIAYNYLPHYVFGLYANPFSILFKKVDLDQIKDFVDRASKDIVTFQLLCLILEKGAKQVVVPSARISEDDPYGDYSGENTTSQQHDNIYILSKLFGII